jgi:quercetin dioxygenase-like cupin family protein
MRSVSRLALGAVLVVALAAPAVGQEHPAAPAPAISWGPPPPVFPAGARFAVLQGDPGQPGVYTVRLDMPSGYTIKPHYHPTDEHITVISGTFMVGMGDSVDTRQMQSLVAGAFITAPAQAHHYAMARGRTVVQVHGVGPFQLTYVNPADMPHPAAATGSR